jgi:hypothetical protein
MLVCLAAAIKASLEFTLSRADHLRVKRICGIRNTFGECLNRISRSTKRAMNVDHTNTAKSA